MSALRTFLLPPSSMMAAAALYLALILACRGEPASEAGEGGALDVPSATQGRFAKLVLIALIVLLTPYITQRFRFWVCQYSLFV